MPMCAHFQGNLRVTESSDLLGRSEGRYSMADTSLTPTKWDYIAGLLSL